MLLFLEINSVSCVVCTTGCTDFQVWPVMLCVIINIFDVIHGCTGWGFFLWDFLDVCKWRSILFELFWSETAKTWWTGVPGKPFGLFYFYGALTSGSGILGHLMEESGTIKPVLWPCIQCSFALSTLMYGTLTGSRSGRSWPYDNLLCLLWREWGVSVLLSMHLFLQGEWSSGTKDTAVLTLQLGNVWLHVDLSRNVHLNAFDGFSWAQVLWPVRPTRIAGSKHYRVIARLIYSTQHSKCLSGVLILWFRSLK